MMKQIDFMSISTGYTFDNELYDELFRYTMHRNMTAGLAKYLTQLCYVGQYNSLNITVIFE